MMLDFGQEVHFALTEGFDSKNLASSKVDLPIPKELVD
jgi:hypothetical protein